MFTTRRIQDVSGLLHGGACNWVNVTRSGNRTLCCGFANFNLVNFSTNNVTLYNRGTSNLGLVYSNLLETYPENGYYEGIYYYYLGEQ